MATDREILTNEYTNDPLVRDYASMTDQEATDDINTDYRFANVLTASGAQLYNGVDPGEEAALPLPDLETVRVIYSLGEQILIGPNTRVRRELVELFPDGTVSFGQLVETFREPITRAHELTLPTIKLGWTQETKP